MRLLLAIGLASLCSAAMAEDQAASATDWTGFYAGVAIGYSQTDVQAVIDEDSSWTSSTGGIPGDWFAATLPAMKGAPVSGHLLAGYGAQMGSAYLGVEGDLVWQEMTAGPIGRRGDLDGPTTTDTSACTDGNHDSCFMSGGRSAFTTFGHLRAITGVVLDPKVMAFAAGGIAIGQAEAGMFNYINDNGVIQSDFDIPSSLLVGLSIGGGVEFKPTENLRIRLEGLLDSYPDWAARDETELGDLEGAPFLPFVSNSLPFITSVSNATARVSAIWQF